MYVYVCMCYVYMYVYMCMYVCMYVCIWSEDKDMVYKDAIYFSMHKFVGGVDSPGNVTWPGNTTINTATWMVPLMLCCYFQFHLNSHVRKFSSMRKSINFAIALTSLSPEFLLQTWRLWFCCVSAGCVGVLVAKKELFENSTPHSCGGGTVFFVSWVINYVLLKWRR